MFLGSLPIGINVHS